MCRPIPLVMIGWVIASPSFPFTVLILVAAMFAAVLVTAALEGRTPPRHTSRPTPGPLPESSQSDRAASLDEPSVAVPVASGPAPEVPGAEPSEDARTQVLVLGSPGLGDPSGVELGPPGVDAEMAAVLFAAYVVSDAPEASRVTGWITSAGDPRSIPEVAAGERLRGRPGRVRALLDRGDGKRNRVILDDRTDVGLAVQRRPPCDPLLAGLVLWWELTTGARPALAASEVPCLRSAIAEVSPVLQEHPLAGKVSEVLRACAVAQDAASGLELAVLPGDPLLRGASTHTDFEYLLVS